MNAVTQIEPSRRREVDQLKVFCPGAVGVERELREAMLKARDYASFHASRVTDDHAAALLSMIISVASVWAYRDAPEEELRDVLTHCRRMAVSALEAERLKVDDL